MLCTTSESAFTYLREYSIQEEMNEWGENEKRREYIKGEMSFGGDQIESIDIERNKASIAYLLNRSIQF